MNSLLLFLPLLQGGDLVLAADRLHVGDGRVVENAIVEIAGGRIARVSTGSPPSGSIHVSGAHITPGLVDTFSFMGVGSATVEESREVTAAQRVSDTANLADPAFARAVAQGVTAAYLSPDSLNVIGGLGAVVKTSGGRVPDLFAPQGSGARVVDSAAALKITLSSDSSSGNHTGHRRSLHGRRPTTRMGTTWVLRNAFHKAAGWAAAGRAGEAVPAHPDYEVLVAAMEGRIPVRVQARRTHDVQTALRLRKEFGWPRMIVEEGTEAYLCAHLLAEAGIPVASGPVFDDITRSIAAGPSLDELRFMADPPAVCCEDQGDDHEHDGGFIPVDSFAFDLLLLTAPRYESASGFLRGRRTEARKATPALARLLDEAGVVHTFGAGEGHQAVDGESSLIHQARIAVRNGLDPDTALRMATHDAARLLGQGDRFGLVRSGYDADLVLWSGPPMSASSKPLLVLVDGKPVTDIQLVK